MGVPLGGQQIRQTGLPRDGHQDRPCKWTITIKRMRLWNWKKKERKEIQKKGRNLVSSVQFSSRWYLSARESPIALRPVSQKCPQCCLWNSSKLMFSWITMTLSRPLKVDRPSLPTSMSLSSRRPKVWCPCSFVPAGNTCLELANTPDLQRHKPLVTVALLQSLSALSDPGDHFPWPPSKSRTVDSQESLEVEVEHCHMMIWTVLLLFLCRPDMTFAVDWALINNYLSIYPLFVASSRTYLRLIPCVVWLSLPGAKHAM